MTGAEVEASEFRLSAVRYDHPDAVRLTELVQRYYEDIYGGQDSERLTPAQLAAPIGGFFVGYVGEDPVAMGGWTYPDDAPRRGDAQIRRMFTHPEVRGQGHGRRVLGALEEDAAARGAARMILSTGIRQGSAVGMYRACGYVGIEPFGYYAGQSGVVCLAKDI